MRLLLLLFIGFGIAVGLNSCTRNEDCDDPSNPNCSNYDPCFGQKPVETEIELSQKVAIAGKFMNDYFDTASTFPKAQIRFHCPLDGAKYTWKLGSETITEQTFERHFFDVPFGEYSVSLIVEKQPNKQCYPNDDGIDTIVKKFRTVKPCELKCFGVFKGKWDNNAADSSVITIRTFDNSNFNDSCQFGTVRFTNLQNKQDTLVADCYVTNGELFHYDPNSFGLGNLNSKLDLNSKSLVLEYFIAEKRYTFRGRKIAD